MSLTTPPVPTVREFILQEATKAFPKPVLASELRRKLTEHYGVQVHEKTFGMTLYRLSKEDPPLMRRVGRQDWFFVPENSEATQEWVASELFS